MTDPKPTDRLEVMQALKPCRNCGGDPEALGEALCSMIRCTKDWREGGCGLHVSAVGNDAYEQVRALWNTRPIETNSRTSDTDVEYWRSRAELLDKTLSDVLNGRSLVQSITPPEVGGELVERITKALSDYASIGHCRTMARAVIAALSTPEVVDGTAGLVEALEWYAEQVAGCRKLGRIGDPARNALDADGGNRARTALSQHRKP